MIDELPRFYLDIDGKLVQLSVPVCTDTVEINPQWTKPEPGSIQGFTAKDWNPRTQWFDTIELIIAE